MEHEVHFDHHRFEPRTGRLWTGRREVSLTPRAAAVLAVLVARAGQLVTRDELFQSVWGETIVGDAALTACIKELRDALADDAKRPRFIETRHRRGYRFAAHVHSPASSTPARPKPAPLVVGRDRELLKVRRCLEHAAAGTRQIVFVTGEPGIGKTALIERFLIEASSSDRLRIAQGRCVETHGAGEASLPLLEAMARLCREPGGQPLIRLLRHHAPTWPLRCRRCWAPRSGAHSGARQQASPESGCCASWPRRSRSWPRTFPWLSGSRIYSGATRRRWTGWGTLRAAPRPRAG